MPPCLRGLPAIAHQQEVAMQGRFGANVRQTFRRKKTHGSVIVQPLPAFDSCSLQRVLGGQTQTDFVKK